jgi:hypothetical protein
LPGALTINILDYEKIIALPNHTAAPSAGLSSISHHNGEYGIKNDYARNAKTISPISGNYRRPG